MADLLVVACTVGGNSIENPAGGYEIVSYGRGASKVRRSTIESNDVAGRLLVAWTRETMLGQLSVLVKGNTAAVCESRMNTLIGWFDQASYTITATLASASVAGNWTESWLCEPADYEVGDSGMIDNVLLGACWQRVTFTWPHHPVQTA